MVYFKNLHQRISQLGSWVIDGFVTTGNVVLFLATSLTLACKKPYRFHHWIQQAEAVGVGSLPIILLTGIFTGAVFTLQSASALERVGMESMVGSLVMLAVTRELAPVLTALMLAGRVSSAMATELGTMRVSEQIDAMEVMAVHPMHYLVVPRLIAGAIMTPLLTSIFAFIAGVGSFLVAVPYLGIDEGAFFSRIQWYVDTYDIMHGFYKSIAFGVVVTTLGCYKGYHAKGGARGVGLATTQAVVIGSVSIFILDYILTSILV